MIIVVSAGHLAARGANLSAAEHPFAASLCFAVTPQRPMFWGIQGVWIFYALAAIAIGVFAYGMSRRVAQWLRGPRPAGWRLGWSDVRAAMVDGLMGRRIFRGDLAAGAMHGLLSWGFAGLFLATLLGAVDHYLVSFLRGPVYLVYAVGADVAGVMLLVGLCWALVRRYLQRLSRLESRSGDLLVLLWLLLACVSGFWVEGVRLALVKPPWSEWSFAGRLVSLLLSEPADLAAVYAASWWLHGVVCLALIAAFPFTKLLHVLAGPTSLALARQAALVQRAEQHGSELDWSLRERVCFDACMRCGRCVEVCPATSAGEPFSPRDIIATLRHRLRGESVQPPESDAGEAATTTPAEPGAGTERGWHCTTCSACLEVCPVCVATPDAVRELRRQLIEQGTAVPAALSQTLEKLFKYQNPWEASKKKRGKWFKGLDVTDLTHKSGPSADWCYFVGCTTAIDTRAQRIALSLLRLFDEAGLSFGILGKKEPCCGDIARRVGEDGLFEEQAEGCLDLFDRYEVRRVVTSSPHCMHTMKSEYPRMPASPADDAAEGAEAQPPKPPAVRHYVELLAELVAERKLRFHRAVDAKLTFHDPCYLGRHNGVFDAPRRLLAAVDGVELVEMAHHGANSLCCGAGGGRMWQEELDAETKMSEIRIREAAATGARIVVTACPLCLIMLCDACKTAGLENDLEVLDLSELLVQALGDSVPRDEAPAR